MSNGSTILLIGGPETGKTNYLSRLWISIESGGGALEKSILPEQLDYLQSGARQILNGFFAGRTPRDSFNLVEIPFKVKNPQSNFGRLSVPDISGEDCIRIYKTREWDARWEAAIKDSLGCLIFLRYMVLEKPMSWIDLQRFYDASKENHLEGDVITQTNVNPNHIPTQILLIEWLQFLQKAYSDIRGRKFIPRFGIIVSAWDELGEEDTEKGPDVFVQNKLPLLAQFIKSNSSEYEFKIFGTSIVGGDLSQDEEFREEYLKGEPLKAGYVVFNNGSSRTIKRDDITIPVAWILGYELNQL